MQTELVLQRLVEESIAAQVELGPQAAQGATHDLIPSDGARAAARVPRCVLGMRQHFRLERVDLIERQRRQVPLRPAGKPLAVVERRGVSGIGAPPFEDDTLIVSLTVGRVPSSRSSASAPIGR